MEEEAEGKMSSPSFRLRCLIPLLSPLRFHINRRMAAKQPKTIKYEAKAALKFSHQMVTHPKITISMSPCRSEYLHDKTKTNPKGIILYFHGGGYLVGSPRAARPITSNLVNKSQHAICYSAKYPLNEPLDNMIEHGEGIYHKLLEEWKPEQIIISGDSAGGHMALSIALRQPVSKQPCGLLLFSPWIDISGQNALDDALLYGDSVRYAGQIICPDGIPPSLANNSELGKLPPIYLQYGTNEILAPDNRYFSHKAKEKGVSIEIDEVDHVFHGFHYAGQFLPESKEALNRAAKFIDQRLSSN